VVFPKSSDSSFSRFLLLEYPTVFALVASTMARIGYVRTRPPSGPLCLPSDGGGPLWGVLGRRPRQTDSSAPGVFRVRTQHCIRGSRRTLTPKQLCVQRDLELRSLGSRCPMGGSP